MQLGNLAMVQRAAVERARLIAMREHGVFSVVIEGRYQDDAMTECARPAIVTELDRRIVELGDDLIALGVVLDEVRR